MRRFRTGDDPDSFEEFVERAEPALRRALVARVGPDAATDAVAEALAWAWEHWDRLAPMANPVGYLYRVAQSKARQRRIAYPRELGVAELPEVDPGLWDALLALPDRQRAAVWLVHGCGWTYAEVATALGVSVSTTGTHVARGMARLRETLEVTPNA